MFRFLVTLQLELETISSERILNV